MITLSKQSILSLQNKNLIDIKLEDYYRNPENAYTLEQKEIYLNEENISGKNLREIPVFNEIAAGNPIEINDEKQENFYLPKEWVDRNNDNFILQIKGG